MKVNSVITGILQENCYIVSLDNNCLIIDPGDDTTKIINRIGNMNVLAILITHRHFDHIGSLDKLKEIYKCNIYDYQNCKEKEYNIENFKFEVIYNPGHSNDSISFYFKKEKIMFVGDFVFKNTIGRCDLDGGNYSEMQNSIQKLKQIKENIILYPGHGEYTNLDDEKENNPYFY